MPPPPVTMVVSNRYDPDPRVHKEAQTLVAAGHSVTVLAFDRMHELPSTETRDGVHVVRLRVRKSPPGNVPATWFGLREFHAAARRMLLSLGAPVIHCHDQDTGVLGVWWKNRNPKQHRFLLDIHDCYWERAGQIGLPALLGQLGSRFLEGQCRTMARRADAVLVATEGQGHQQGLLELISPWGLKPTALINAASPRAERPAPFPETFCLAYIGSPRRLEPFVWLVEALRLLPQERRPHLFIAGSGVHEKAIGKLLSEAARELKFSLELQGRYDPEQLEALHAKTSVQYALLPPGENTARALPCKMFDAVVRGRPVIGNADLLMGDWIQNKEWGWTLRAGDIGALAQVIDEAQSRYRDVAARMQPAPLWSEQEEILLNVYRDLGAARPSR